MRRSQPVKAKPTKIDNQIQTKPTFFGTPQNEMEAGSQTLSARVIVANVLTCESARTSILFLGAKHFLPLGFTPACSSLPRPNQIGRASCRERAAISGGCRCQNK